ncbi:hypothetical protein [Kitasatospora sp. NPDC097643]|uniref:hypothetical protein n=1 Tax=Kitasatospora sp. NPDC097643 TaxID=3157230 RepID=UPI00332D24C3
MTDGQDEQRDEETPRPLPGGGGVTIGHLAGGAVAAGERASAEDRSQRSGAVAVPAAPTAGVPMAMAMPPAAPGVVAIGTMTGGALASGTDARAVDSSVHLDPSARHLLDSVRTLRRQLPLLVRADGDGTAEVEHELAAVDTDLERTGTTPRTRLERLLGFLRGSGTVVSGLASALAVVQAIEQFLG